MMNNFFDAKEYLSAVCELGRAVYQKENPQSVFDMFGELSEREKNSSFFLTYAHTREVFGLSRFESVILAHSVFCAASFCEPLSVSELIMYSDAALDGISLVFNISGEKLLCNKSVLNFILERLPSPSKRIAVDFCAGIGECVLSDFSDEITKKAEGFLAKSDDNLILSLVGEKDSGKKYLAKRTAKALGSALIIIDGKPDEKEISEAVILQALYQGIICFDSFTSIDRAGFEDILDYSRVVFILSAKPLTRADTHSKPFLELKIPELTITEKLIAFDIFSEKGLLKNEDDIKTASHRYSLKTGQIKAISQKLSLLYKFNDRKIDSKQLINTIKEESSCVSTFGAQMISSDKTFGDIILPDEQKAQLKNICAFACQREKIFSDWGFDKKITYGRGISMLFYGASGTGKTMAAQVMANEMGLELYRIDLSQMISKYIGETQKNIGEVFDKAQKTDCVLFFDEADALFSKRSDVTDSQDKYSNAEIAYLLQKTEQYSGVTIMATNLFQNFDEAFRRRITFMVNFPMPDAALRLFLWKGIFPENAPTDSIDYQYLADSFELSGAAIKGAALYAAYLSAVNEGPIGMEEIILGIKNEYSKLGKSIDSRLKLKLQQYV